MVAVAALIGLFVVIDIAPWWLALVLAPIGLYIGWTAHRDWWQTRRLGFPADQLRSGGESLGRRIRRYFAQSS
jgi:uncharacterized membrane protein YphA (DoxX/SURF4 family)